MEAGSQIKVVLEIGADLVPEACAVMHDAFGIYADRGPPSGALLETPDSLIAEMRDGRRIAVAIVDERVAAMVKYAVVSSDGSLYFSRLSVATWAQGRRFARRLVEALRAEGGSLSCHVRADESGNIALYEPLGMRVVGRELKPSLTGALIPVVRMADAQFHNPGCDVAGC